MWIPEHAQAARDFLVEANDAIATDRRLTAAEMLWAAAAHAIIAVAQQRGWPYHYHRDLTSAAKRLAIEYQDWEMWDGAKAAEQCHIYFYHGRMFDGTLDESFPLVRYLVARLLALTS